MIDPNRKLSRLAQEVQAKDIRGVQSAVAKTRFLEFSSHTRKRLIKR